MDMVDEAYNKAEDFDDESPEEESGDDGFGSRETSKVKNVIAFSSRSSDDNSNSRNKKGTGTKNKSRSM